MLFISKNKDYPLSEILTKEEIAKVDSYLQRAHDTCNGDREGDDDVRMHCTFLRLQIAGDRPIPRKMLTTLYNLTFVLGKDDELRKPICKKLRRFMVEKPEEEI